MLIMREVLGQPRTQVSLQKESSVRYLVSYNRTSYKQSKQNKTSNVATKCIRKQVYLSPNSVSFSS